MKLITKNDSQKMKINAVKWDDLLVKMALKKVDPEKINEIIVDLDNLTKKYELIGRESGFLFIEEKKQLMNLMRKMMEYKKMFAQ